MSSKPKSTIWPAEPHTIAKIEIVERYLYKWAVITGTTFAGKPLTYIDGFAGPGEYSNHPNGSPMAALAALNKARTDQSAKWKATDIRALFVEQDSARFDHLKALIEERNAARDVKWIAQNCSFVEGLSVAESSFSKAFFTSAPLVVFIDPFGATGFPWDAVKRILASKTSEIILNFDADGMARIASAGKDANADEILTTIFGGDEWRDRLKGLTKLRDKELALLNLYKEKLRSLPNVKYMFSFEMASSTSNIDYFLLFASQHRQGLVKMKESMRELDKDGAYRFSDAEQHQGALFRYDQPEDWVGRFVDTFDGKDLSFDDALTYILNETPFFTVPKLLGAVESQGFLEVESTNPKRRKGTFPEETTKRLKVRSPNA
ncbi:MAG: three-Cys-motif partner protein TcmP [Fimbriimonadaceae bacterium]|nr:three-Cys-motif partner protein TcmP [Fimbriimonadaceae bacterium]